MALSRCSFQSSSGTNLKFSTSPCMANVGVCLHQIYACLSDFTYSRIMAATTTIIIAVAFRANAVTPYCDSCIHRSRLGSGAWAVHF